MLSATALACPNIALIKYWGNRDAALRLPENGSLSINLDGLQTRTKVTFSPGLTADYLVLNGKPIAGPGLTRVCDMLDLVRNMTGQTLLAKVESANNFPTAAGIASSAAAFAALALAATSALGLDLNERELSRLARRGSGSACRSIPGGFVEWQAGGSDADSYAFSIAPSEYWDLVDCIAVVSAQHKPTGSTEGHALAGTSPLQSARVADAPRRLAECRSAVLEKDFARLAEIVELDSNLMHAVMQTSTPPLLYWQPATLAVMQTVQGLRKRGIPACYTIDAGANVHVWTLAPDAARVKLTLEAIPGVTQVIQAGIGGPARIE
jgi:diphosphomevalonate decarboxylase